MRFREARLKAGKSVQEVCREIGVTDAAVYLWETGDITPRLDNMKKLAKLYGVTLDYLVSDPSD